MPLITKLDELRPYLPVAYGTVLTMPPFAGAEENYLKPVIGDQLYGSLAAAFAGNSLTDDQSALLAYCRAVIAPFSYTENLPFLQTQITNAGMIAIEVENSRKAFKWEFNVAIEALNKKGYAAIEQLILFLRGHESAFPEWVLSPYRTSTQCGLIQSGADLASLSLLQQPHRCFMTLKGLLDTVVLMHLTDVVGEDYYQALNSRLLAGTAGDQEKRLAEFLRPMLCRRLMEFASLELSISFNGSSFTIVDDKNKDISDEGKKAADDKALLRFREQMQSTAIFFQEKALQYLNKYASSSVFPEFFSSSNYSPPIDTTNDTRNEKFTGVFAM